MANYQYFADGGFVAIGESAPQIDAPRDWMIWHFTQLPNLQSIVNSGALVSDDSVGIHATVADARIKETRRRRVVSALGYPGGRAVSAHVPFYYAAKSPMLNRVTRAGAEVTDSILFLGVRVGDVLDAELQWCASDGNAAAGVTQFSNELSNLGNFIDFPLMSAKWWNNVPDDMNRASRRAAEFLVFDRLPLELVTLGASRSEATVSEARRILSAGGYTEIKVSHSDALFY